MQGGQESSDMTVYSQKQTSLREIYFPDVKNEPGRLFQFSGCGCGVHPVLS
jgi:hypothetical protein